MKWSEGVCALIEFLIFEELVIHVAISTNRSSYWLQCCHSYHTIIMACAYGSLLHALFTTRHKNRVVSKLFVSLLAAIQLSTSTHIANFLPCTITNITIPWLCMGFFFLHAKYRSAKLLRFMGKSPFASWVVLSPIYIDDVPLRLGFRIGCFWVQM